MPMPSVVADLVDVEVARRLNSCLLPVRYGQQFYRDVQRSNMSFTAILDNAIIGIICCLHEDHHDGPRAYIGSLGVLPLYRGQGVATQLLRHMLARAEARGYRTIYLHVQTSNDVAVDLYERNGFVKTAVLTRYYSRIVPADAFLLQRQL